MFVGGEGVSRGYLKRETLTSERFIKDPYDPNKRLYRTGDLARLMNNGELEYLGRIDSQVKIRGFRIELGEIEAQLSTHRKINETVVLAGEKQDDQYLVAYYVSEKEIEPDELRTYLSEKLPAYMLPSHYIWLESLPLTANGKLNRKALPGPDLKGEEYEAPSNETETKLVEIWSEILKLETNAISVSKSFFELGGHSLRATKLVFRIQKEFQCEMSLIDIFKSSTIKELSRKLQHKKNRVHGNELLTLLKQNPDSTDNLFFIHDISGDIQAYAELSGLINHYNCWGIRSAVLKQHIPQALEVGETVKHYIGIMKSIQPEGPYQIAGWSIGGIIAYEMVNQLEAAGEKVNTLLMIDSQFPFMQSNDRSKEDGFTLAKERVFVSRLLGKKPKILETADTLEKLWDRATLFIKESRLDLSGIKKRIPDEIRDLIPHLNEIELDDLVIYVNAIRTWTKAVAKYQVKGKLKTQLAYIKASETDFDFGLIGDYFENSATVIEISGNHFSILKQPHVYEMAKQVENELQKNIPEFA
jgi:thioesterase domain-containing protein/acyl carrier protein